jgi:hypothetical protein
MESASELEVGSGVLAPQIPAQSVMCLGLFAALHGLQCSRICNLPACYMLMASLLPEQILRAIGRPQLIGRTLS